jgi:hypothetical protein
MAGPERSPARTGRKKTDEGGETLPPAEVMVRPHVPAIALPARLARLDVRGRLDELAIYGEDEVGLLDEAARMCSAGEVRSAIEERATVIRRDLAARAKVAREEERDEGLIRVEQRSLRRPMAPADAAAKAAEYLARQLQVSLDRAEMQRRHKAEKEDLAESEAILAAELRDAAEGMEQRLCEVEVRVIGGDTVTFLRSTGEEVDRRKATEDEIDKARQRKLFPGGGW